MWYKILTRDKKNKTMQTQQWSRATWRDLLHAVNGYMCVHIHTMGKCVCVGCISPSTHAGRARVVPAICPLRQAQRAVCLAIVRLGWLLSLFNITISHVPTANWPVEDTHEYIHFRKRDIKNTDISSKILLYKLQHEGLMSLKWAYLCVHYVAVWESLPKQSWREINGWLSVK